MRTLAIFITLIPVLSLAEPEVKIMHNPGKESRWEFKGLIPPAANDVGSFAKFTMIKGQLHSTGDRLGGLSDGMVSNSKNDAASQHVFLDGPGSGVLVCDLGKVIRVAAVNSYSSHVFKDDHGARAPQVFTLYGRKSGQEPWQKIANVDSRPNKSGVNWGGKYAVNITAKGGLGNFRYLKWEIHPTRSPLQKKYVMWTQTFFSEIDIHSEATLKQVVKAKPFTTVSQVEEIIIVSKTHFDIGFTALAKDVVRRYQTSMIDGALQVVEKSNHLPKDKRFAWTLPGWPLSKILEDWDGQTPQRKRKLVSAIRNGRLVTHALPYTIETEASSSETLARSLIYSSNISRKYGVPLPRAAKVTDVPSQGWGLVPILKNGGIDFLHMGCNPASQAPDVPRLFWWQGTDGSRLLTMYNKDYGSSILPPKNWPYKTWLAMVMTGDNHGPPNANDVKRMLEQAAEVLPNARIRFGKMEDFYDAILKEKDKIPTVIGDMPDGWIHGLGTDPEGLSCVRRYVPQIATAELLNGFLETQKVPVDDISLPVAKAYHDAIRFTEHTWGFNSHYMRPKRLYGNAWQAAWKRGEYKKWEDSWEEKGAFPREVKSGVSAFLERQVTMLAASVDVQGAHLVVFNSMPWKRSGVVRFDAEHWDKVTAVQDVQTKEVLPVSTKGNTATVVVRDVPSGGYRSYIPVKTELGVSDLKGDANTQTIENRFYRITVSKQQGAITSIFDKRGQRELIDSANNHGFGSYFYERFGHAEVDRFLKQYLRSHVAWAYNDMGKRDLPTNLPYLSDHSRGMELETEFAPNQVSLILKSGKGKVITHPFSLRVTLYESQDHIDVTWRCQGKQPIPEPEGGWLCLPFNLGKVSYYLDRTGGITDPGRDLVKDTYRDISCIQGGMAMVSEKGHGVYICPLDTSLISLERPGLWRFSKGEFSPSHSAVFVNLFNNQWGTNYPQWIAAEELSSTVRIRSFEKYEPSDSLVTPGLNDRQPLVGVVSNKSGGLPASSQGISTSRKGVRVSAFGKNPDGKGVILRVWEKAGKASELVVTLPPNSPWRSAIPCDLRGEPVGQVINIKEGVISTRIKANSPVSFILK